MLRLLPVLLLGVMFIGAARSHADTDYTVEQAARAAAADYLAPLARPDTKAVTLKVTRCRDLGRWHGCRVHVSGAAHYNVVLRVRVIGDTYAAWMPRARSR